MEPASRVEDKRTRIAAYSFPSPSLSLSLQAVATETVTPVHFASSASPPRPPASPLAMAPVDPQYPSMGAPIGAAPTPDAALAAAPAPAPAPMPAAAPAGAASGSAGGFDGVQKPQLGSYPPAEGKVATGPTGYPSVNTAYPSVGAADPQLPAGYPGATGPYAPAGAPPPGGGPVMGMAPGGAGHGGVAGDKIGPLGITAWVLFIGGIIFPICWVVACFLPMCARKAAKGPKDAMAVRRAAIASSIALCVYLVLLVVLVSVGSTSWKSRQVCVDRYGARYYC
ncbi:MAG: hypothetical protein J3K34DRAFT_519348 [Monoraphidium minutum]|nr:MAG: hypothetical protein J3K34DRAFT_519348 [Monoraphidium minutum]